MKIAVIGTGYVGLVTGVCFAETGNQVTCMDVDERKIALLQEGKPPFYEPQLDRLLSENLERGRIAFTTKLEEAVSSAEVIFLALPTPPGADGAADVSVVLEVARDLSPFLRDGAVVVTKSTVPVGTTEKVKEIIAGRTKAHFYVASNPEFLREGRAVSDFLYPDRVVIGVEDRYAEERLRQLYEPFVRQGNPIIVMDIRSAELTKYAANLFLAMRVSFINEVALLCERLGADVEKVRLGIGTDARIGKHYLFPGIGYGGSCFPKDVQAIIRMAEEAGLEPLLPVAVHRVNERQHQYFVEKIVRFYGSKFVGVRLAVWGLSFKANTDDVRESPAIYVVKELVRKGAQVRVHDPVALESARRVLGEVVEYVDNMYEVLEGADGLVIATEWLQFRTPDFAQMKRRMRLPVIFDGRNLYDPEVMRRAGFSYVSVGRREILVHSL